MGTTQWWGVVAAIVLLFSGCVDEPPIRPVVLERRSMSDDDVTAYLAAAATGQMKEGRLASEKAAREDVRAYGDRMFREHRSLLDRTMAVAAQSKIGVDLAPESARLLAEHRARMEGFMSQRGLGFDTAYLDETIAVHENILRTMDRAALETRPSKMGRLLTDSHAVYKSHLDAARAIQRLILTGD
ncbi:MAG TPA: DUF4142 domain-containing protein [Nitrospiraceae bacterium]|nr:DUF4142 domain-containing protein [Nitrospiraceae bacterium]